jgi:CubicO group peptidase (beta-lactamase class C family)
LINSHRPSRPQYLSLGFYLQHYAAAVDAVLRKAGVDSHLGSIFDALAPRGMRGFDIGSAESLRVAIPAANGLFTARSLAAVYALMAGGGELDGVRLMSERTVETASTLVRSPGKYAVIPLNMQWRLGYHGVYTNRGFRKRAFGHFGFGGSGAWADPDLDLSLALITNSGMGSTFGDSRIARISGAAVESAQRAL